MTAISSYRANSNLCRQAYIFHEAHLQPQLAGLISGQEERREMQTGLAPEAVNATEARVLAQGAVQLKAQAQNFQVQSSALPQAFC